MDARRQEGSDPRLEDCINETCPWSGRPVQADSLALYAGHVVGFCNPGCRDKYATAARHFDSILDARQPAPANRS